MAPLKNGMNLREWETVFGGCSSKQVFLKICKFHTKALVLESLFNKVAGPGPTILLKRDSNTGVFL